MLRLEVIACSVEDAIAAAQGGADRLELISRFDVGGLTPALGLVTEVLAAVSIPVRVMLRENAGFGIENAAERERLYQLAAELARMRIDGLVLGFLVEGQIDTETMTQILSRAPELPITFHRAFEALPDPCAAARQLKDFPQIDRILTSGGAGAWTAKVADLAELEEAAAPEIQILLGGGVDAEAIALLRQHTHIQEFHVGRAARSPQSVDGVVSAARVAELKRLLAQ